MSSMHEIELVFKSIEHYHLDIWPDLLKAYDLELMFAAHCPLCEEYLHRIDFVGECSECPIKKKTGRNFCAGTPWADMDDALRKYFIYREYFLYEGAKDLKSQAEQAVLTEIAFLVDLIPDP